MILIIDGPEKAGKSTIIAHLRELSQEIGLKVEVRAWGPVYPDDRIYTPKLQQDVENYKVAYGCARRVEEQELGHRVPSKVNTETAAAQLRQYNIVAVADTTGSGLRLVRPLSAQSVLLDAEPAEPTGPKIEPCE